MWCLLIRQRNIIKENKKSDDLEKDVDFGKRKIKNPSWIYFVVGRLCYRYRQCMFLDFFGGSVLDFEDFLVSNLFLPLGAMAYLLFCVTRYGWGFDAFMKEANEGKGMKIQKWMRVYFAYVLPFIILFIFGFGIYDKFFRN